MSVNLSSEEIEALKQGIDDGLLGEDYNNHVNADAKPYNFGVDGGHHMVSCESFTILHEKCARHFLMQASRLLHPKTFFEFKTLNYMKYEDYKMGLHMPLIFGVFDLQSSNSNIIISCPISLPSMVMEYYFGGSLTLIESEKSKLSPSEERIMMRFMSYLGEALRLSWSELFPFNFSKIKMENNINHIAHYDLPDYVVVSEFLLTLEDMSPQLVEICYPFHLFRTIFPLIQDKSVKTLEKSNPDWKIALEQAVMEISLTMTSVLTEPRVNLAWVMNLEEGTTLDIPAPHQASCRISGKEFATGVMGTSSNHTAVRISNIHINL